jgi:hypothetical protein
MQEPKTILPQAVLVSLYKDTLVLPEMEIKSAVLGKKVMETTSVHEAVNEQKVITPTPLKFLGDHLKKIAVIVNDPNAVHLNETDLGLLSSILNACKLTLADIALINTAQQPISLHETLTTLPSQFVIAFDLSSTQLKIKLPSTIYKPIVLGETQILFSNSLQSMQGVEQNAKMEKAKLWNALKLLFKL